MRGKRINSGLIAAVFVLAACTKIETQVVPQGSTPDKPQTETHTKVQEGDLIRAIAKDDYREVVSLLDKGANINENIGSETKEITPLLTAVALDRQKIAELLLERGAATHPTYNRYTARDFALYRYGDTSPLRRALIQREIRKTSAGETKP